MTIGILQDIQFDAVNPQISIVDLVRKCLVLAYRIDNQEFTDWVTRELDGFPEGVPLPPSRTHEGMSRGSGFGSGVKRTDTLVPLSALPDKYREVARMVHFREGAGRYVGVPDDGKLVSPWQYELTELLNQGLADSGFYTAYIPLPPGLYRGMLDAIRNKVLRFTLEIGKVNPDVDNTSFWTAPRVQEQISQIFYVTVQGGQPIIGSSGTFEQKQVVAATAAELRKVFLDQGANEASLDELKDVLDEDDIEDKKSKVGEWVKKAFGGATEQVKDLAAKTIAQ